ncbi:MucBP domain-containing protein [Levilactobacillus brevis]|uniref:MucBP domain-containing protein n=1 Tax=Levilactobacillus brevis TaxID=1580 RepID=UPI001CDB0F17|nr:MucBP domain-containing protein [Levilactobacillus brevis]MCM6798287.1 MucBP domain-containing protein [Levilactobacillus brevis]MCM6800767.1 MucBP domain-containing protein [Levilactobacillus brevis]MCM6806249.1 MucBP domain-containing protein [Levilactobacillus brevis]MCM6808575.1 MucBP domain-containing protein [Levilactobacillus brevis]MCM6814462.1 MucBP domain-containing protein [Levilactobacillus brevis]
MFKAMNSKEHYKMYKKGKLWMIAGVFTATVMMGLMGGQPAQAATTTTSDATTTETVTPAKATATEQFSAAATPASTASSAITPNSAATSAAQSATQAATSSAAPVISKTASAVTPDSTATNSTSTPASAAPSSVAPVSSAAAIDATKVATPVSAATAQVKAATTRNVANAAAVAPVAATVQSAAPADVTIDQWMPDTNLQQVVLHELAKTTGITSADQITQAMMGNLTKLYVDTSAQQNNKDYYLATMQVRSLQGLEYAKNLTDLWICPNLDANLNWTGAYMKYGSISDISALAGLTNLTELNLQMNQISNISALKNLKLKGVSLSYNQISDLSPLQNSKDTMSTSATMAYQIIKLPTIVLNAKTTSYTMPSFIITNLDGGNVPITPVQTSPYFGMTSAGTGTNLDDATVAWKDLGQSGYLFVDWHDTLLGLPGYPFDGEIVQLYTLSDSVGNVNVNFKTTSGLSLAPQVTLSGNLGDDFDLNQSATVMNAVQKIMAQGYAYQGTADDMAVTGVYAEDPTNITLLFGVKKLAATFNFIDDQGHTLAVPQTMTGDYGQAWQTQVPSLKGYTFKQATQDGQPLTLTDGQLAGTLTADTTINLIYTADTKTATVHYVYADGSEAAPSQTVSGKYGDTIAFPTSPVIKGYTASELTPAKYGDENTFTVTYTADTKTATVHYVYADGSEAAPSQTVSGKYGDTIAFPTSPVIKGYTASKLPTSVFGDNVAANTFTITYTKDAVTPPTPTQQVTVTVHYQDSDGKAVASDFVFTKQVGDRYTTSPADVKNYRLQAIPANASGVVGDQNIVVTYVYVQQSGDGDQVTPDQPGTTTPTKPVKPTKPTQPAKQPTVNKTGGQADQVRVGTRVKPQAAVQNGATQPAVSAKATTTPAGMSDPTQTTLKTLPQTGEQATSPWWGIVLLGSLLGLAGFRREKRH